jgi:hypothetical protein
MSSPSRQPSNVNQFSNQFDKEFDTGFDAGFDNKFDNKAINTSADAGTMARGIDADQPIIIRPAPRREPHFDDEIPPGARNLAGRYDQRLPFELHPPLHTSTSATNHGTSANQAGSPSQTTSLRLITGSTAGATGRSIAGTDRSFGTTGKAVEAPARTSAGSARTAPPASASALAATSFARKLLIAIIETATGRRSLSQIAPHLSPALLAGLAKDTGRITRRGTAAKPATVYSLHLVEPADKVAEVAAVIRVEDRYRAVALRLEVYRDNQWRCVRLQIG